MSPFLLFFMFDYSGAIHFHSHYSFDCKTTLDEIIAAAQNSQLDFLILTDHFRLDALKDGWEDWHRTSIKKNKSVLLIVGEEITPRYNHYLALNIKKPILTKRNNVNAQKFIDQVNQQNGFGFIAHPDDQGAPLFKIKAYPWIDWQATNFTGLSIWNLISDWMVNLTSLPRAILAYCFPVFFLPGPNKKTLTNWDKLNQSNRKTIAIGELDNHNSVHRQFGYQFRIFPFSLAFRSIRTHILTDTPFSGDKGKDIDLVYSALKKGTVYIAQEKWHNATGFQFSIFNDLNKALMGDTFLLSPKSKLQVLLPTSGKIELFRNGTSFYQSMGDHLELPIEQAGVYRVEVMQRKLGFWKPWIYSNPIWVTQAELS